MKNRYMTFMPLLAVLMLGACESASNLFSEADNTVLPGERISVLQLQKELVPRDDLSFPPLAEAWTNQFWPQTGGYPNHAMGHLALGDKPERAWRVSIGKGGSRRTPLTVAPIVAEGLVFTLDTAGSVSAFDLASGKRKWEQSVVPRGEEDTGAVGGGLAYASGRLFVTNGYKNVSAVDPATGSLVWRADVPAPARAAPTVMDDRVYVMTLDSRLIVLSVTDGAPIWNYTGVSADTNLLGSASPAADSTIVVLPVSSGEVYGLRPENGRVVWQDNLSAVRRLGSLSSITDIRALPVIDQGVVYAVSYSGRMVALNQVTGERLWQREVGSAETPWAAGDVVYLVSSEQQLVALSRRTGDVFWMTQLQRKAKRDKEENIVWSGPVLAGGRLIAVSSDGQMAEFNAIDGKELRRQKLSSDATIAPVVASGTLLVLTDDGDLTAYR